MTSGGVGMESAGMFVAKEEQSGMRKEEMGAGQVPVRA